MALIPMKRIVEIPGIPLMRTRIVSPSATNVVRAFHQVHSGALVPGWHGARHAARAGAAVTAKSAAVSATRRRGCIEVPIEFPGASQPNRIRRCGARYPARLLKAAVDATSAAGATKR